MKKILNIKYPWMNNFSNARQRCNDKNCKDYPRYGGRGIKFIITHDEFRILWFRDKAYNLKRPSIDRINNDGNYEFSNCRFIEMGLNSTERNIRVSSKPILQYSLDGKFIKEWPSATCVEHTLSMDQGNISKVCLNKYKQAYGFIWKFKPEAKL